MAQSMLKTQGVPTTFLLKAVNWSIHILNRSLTFVVKNMILEKAWNGHKPAINYFNYFGRIAYIHVPDEKRKKFDDKGEKYIFFGVNDHSKKPINCTIPPPRRSSSILMYNLMKIKYETRQIRA